MSRRQIALLLIGAALMVPVSLYLWAVFIKWAASL